MCRVHWEYCIAIVVRLRTTISSFLALFQFFGLSSFAPLAAQFIMADTAEDGECLVVALPQRNFEYLMAVVSLLSCSVCVFSVFYMSNAFITLSLA